MADQDERPVLSGLVALVAVAVVVGLLAGVGALAVSRMAGLTGASGDPGSTPEGGDTLYLPDPTITPGDDGPLVTLLPTDDDETATDQPTDEESEEPRKKRDREKKDEDESQIVLSASQQSVSPMERIDLTGVYPGGEGAILRVQRFESGQWADFPVSANVANETFTTYVETGRSGVNRFRMIDPATGRTSNEVRVTVG